MRAPLSLPRLADAAAHAASVAAFVALALAGCKQPSAVTSPSVALPAATAVPLASPCPAEMAFVASVGSASQGVCIDRFEAALEGRRFSAPVDGIDAGALFAVPAKGLKPQVNVNEPQAEAACEAASKRLCTEKEWTAACRGPSNLTYPYGAEHIAGACNEGKPRPSGVTEANLADPRLAESPNGIEPGGSRPRCVSAFGVYDLYGNVHEWVSDDSNPRDPRYGMFLGGYFADGSENGPGCTYKTTAHFKTYHDYSTGFRCCKDPAATGRTGSATD